MQVTVEFQGLDQLIQKLKTLPEAIKAEADDVCHTMAETLARTVQRRYPRKTGRLRRAVRVKRLGQMAYQVRAGGIAPIIEKSKEQERRTKQGWSRGVMPRLGPIFTVERMRATPIFKRELEKVLARKSSGGFAPGGVGML